MGLWVARMVMASEYCCDEIPFKDVIIHPTVMGADGKPMSKSRGNGVDPVKLMEDYGADGMRFGLLMQVTGAQAMRFDYQKIESSRNFANKIRNAARFVLMHLDGFEPGEPELVTPADRWIFSRLANLVAEVDEAFDRYEFSDITRALYGFFWNEFCDWYIEFSKSRLSDAADPADRLACQRNLVFVLDQALRLLHPIMPFITEEIYQEMPVKTGGDMLIGAEWPDAEALAVYRDEASERAIELVCEVVGAIRSSRARYGISPKHDVARRGEGGIARRGASRCSIFDCARACERGGSDHLRRCRQARGGLGFAGVGHRGVHHLVGYVDFAAEKARLEKEQGKVARRRGQARRKSFRTRVFWPRPLPRSWLRTRLSLRSSPTSWRGFNRRSPSSRKLARRRHRFSYRSSRPRAAVFFIGFKLHLAPGDERGGFRFTGGLGLREIDRAAPFTAREQRILRFLLFPAPVTRWRARTLPERAQHRDEHRDGRQREHGGHERSLRHGARAAAVLVAEYRSVGCHRHA